MFWILALSVTTFFVSGWVCFKHLRTMARAFSAYSFQRIDAELLSIEKIYAEEVLPTGRLPADEDIVDIKVSYRYQVNGRKIESKRVMFGPTSPRVARKICDSARVGTKLTIFCDQSSPEEAVIVRGVSATLSMLFFASLVVWFVSLLGAIVGCCPSIFKLIELRSDWTMH